MKNITTIFSIVLFMGICSNIHASQTIPNIKPLDQNEPLLAPFYVNLETGMIVGADGTQASAPQDIQGLVFNPQPQSGPSFSSKMTTAFKKAATGKDLSDSEGLMINSIFLTVDLVNACHTLLRPIAAETVGPKPSNSEILFFLATVTAKATVNLKNPLIVLQEELAYKNNALFTKAVVGWVVNQVEQESLKKVQSINRNSLLTGAKVEEVNAFTQSAMSALGMVKRIIKGESTFMDRVYFKISKSIIYTVDWIRTKVFKKQSIRVNFSTNIVNTILANDRVQGLYQSAQALAENANHALDIAVTFAGNAIEFGKDTITQIKDAAGNVVDSIKITANDLKIKLGDKTEDVKTYISQNIESLSTTASTGMATITQTIGEGTEQIRHVYTVSKETADAAFATAKEAAASALNTVKDGTQSALETLTEISQTLISTNAVTIDNCIESTYAFLDSIPQTIGQTIATILSQTNDIRVVMTALTALQFANPEAFDLLLAEDSPTLTLPSQDALDHLEDIRTLFNTESDDRGSQLATIQTNDTAKLESAIYSTKENLIQDIFNSYLIADFINPDGSSRIDITEIVKDSITTRYAQERINTLRTTASLQDKKHLNQLLDDFDTAIAQRMPTLSNEEQQEYVNLLAELELHSGLAHQNELYDWLSTLTSEQMNLIMQDVNVVLIQNLLSNSIDQDLNTQTTSQLAELKESLTDFVIEAEMFGYGNTMPDAISEKIVLLQKAGINSKEQQQKILDTLKAIDQKIITTITSEYAQQNDKISYLTKLNQTTHFKALSNQTKIDFINGLKEISTAQKMNLINSFLNEQLNNLKTSSDIMALQTKLFAHHDDSIPGLNEKIKNILVTEYNNLKDHVEQGYFSQEITSTTSMTDSARAFKTLSFSDQKEISSLLGIAQDRLQTFQKAALADKIYFAKTPSEINSLKTDINTLGYFTNQDLNNKYGYGSVADALITKTQEIVEYQVNSHHNPLDYINTVLLDLASDNPYAKALRELPLKEQYAVAESLNIHTSSNFKEFQKSIIEDEFAIATTTTELESLKTAASSVGVDTTLLQKIEERYNQSINSTITEEPIAPRAPTLDPTTIIEPTTATNETSTQPSEPTIEEIQQKFNQETLSQEFYGTTKEEQEKERMEDLARKAEAKAEEIAIEHPAEHAI